MRKGALKKKQRQLEELHIDRREALGELVLGMFVQGNWDEDIMSRGAAEVREVADELSQLTAPEATPEPETGEHTGENEMPETAEHTGVHDLPDAGDAPETGEHTGEQEIAAAATATAPVPKPTEEKQDAHETSEPAVPDAGSPAGEDTTSGADGGESESAPAKESVKTEPDAKEQGAPTGIPLPSKAGAGTRPTAPAEPQQTLSELDRMAERIAASETQAKTASEAAKAAVEADARTELSAITREIESDRSKLDAALKEAAVRIESAEKRADAAESKLARESAANREAAADWVRSQAAEIEADAALAAEIAADPAEGAPASAAGDDRPELEARIKALETALEAEKASKAEALTIAESRLKAIEESAREAEKRVEEAEAAVTEAGTAPVAVDAAPGVVTEAEAREAAVIWLRGQIGALRQEIGKSPTPESGEDS